MLKVKFSCVKCGEMLQKEYEATGVKPTAKCRCGWEAKMLKRYNQRRGYHILF
jgi:hypothetical protein